MNSKIFVIYHKPESPIVSEILQPILAGYQGKETPTDFLLDNQGDNISDKNRSFNEMTAIYWVYKHLNEFQDVKYIGFSHYRRFFCFGGLDKTAYVKKNFDMPLCEPKDNQLEQIFIDYDFVAPKPSYYKSVEQHYNKTHNKLDLQALRKIINEKCPKFTKDADEYLGSSKEYLYNMFVFNKEDFVEYSNFVFSVLDEFSKQKGNNDRLYISERLTGIYITYLINKGKQGLFLPVLHVRKKSLKVAMQQVKKNFKEKKDKGLIYKLKPLILYFLPRNVEQYFRRRKTR